MKFKTGVSPQGLRRPIREALPTIDEIHQDLSGGKEAVVTSTTEGKHSVPRSAHYRGDAVDLRTWHVDPHDYAERIKAALGDDFVVLVEATHIHCHWGPVYQEETRE